MTGTFGGCERLKGMRTRTLLPSLLLLLLTPGVAAAKPARLGTPEVLAAFSGESDLIGSSSAPGHGDAYAVFHRIIGKNLYTVIYADEGGHQHRFDLPTSAASFPEAVRLVPLQDGAGMAVWDDDASGRVLARTWTRGGVLGPEQTVLSGVDTVGSGDNDYAKWVLRDDGRGTVAVATVGARPEAAAAVVAAVRDPGGDFGAQQVLDPGGQPGAYDSRSVLLTPIDPDGSLTVSWSQLGLDGSPGGAARRVGRAAGFVPADPAAFSIPAPSARGGRELTGPDGRTIALTARLAGLCPCLRPQVFTWPSGAAVLAFQRYDGRTRFSRSWYVARGDGRGSFDRAARATIRAAASPVRRSHPGEVGFASFDTETDYQLFHRRSRLTVVPFGPAVPRSRRAPRVEIGTAAPTHGRYVRVPISCDRVCTVTVRGARGRRLPLTGFAGPRLPARVEPFTVVYARVHLGDGQDRLRVRVLARDDAGHRARAGASFRRSSRPLADWPRVGSQRR